MVIGITVLLKRLMLRNKERVRWRTGDITEAEKLAPAVRNIYGHWIGDASARHCWKFLIS